MSKSTTHINQGFNIFKTVVALEDFFYDHLSMAEHCLVESLIEPGIFCHIIEYFTAMSPLKCSSST